MKTSVSLTIESETLKKVKLYAKKHQVSVSSMVEEYFEKLVRLEEEVDTSLFDMIDKLKLDVELPENFDYKKEYYEAKAKKYGL